MAVGVDASSRPARGAELDAEYAIDRAIAVGYLAALET
jgi:hypothetical protein